MKDIKITGMDVFFCTCMPGVGLEDSTRAIGETGYIVANVHTNAGISGVGLTYFEAGNNAIRSFIKEVIEPLVIGMSPFETEVIYEKVLCVIRGVGRKGLAFCALSAVDIALWDIKGKVFGMPVFRLLGGSSPVVPVYASGGWTSHSVKALVEEAAGFVEAGFKMIKIKVGVEGGKNIKEDIRRVEAVRRAIGPDIRLAVDANNVWKTGEAIQFAKAVKDFDLVFFEEPVIADDIPGLAHCRRMIDMPLATGEHEYTRYGIRELLDAGAADIVQVDGCKSGGYTEMLKIISVIQAHNAYFAPHCQELMHMHLVAAATNGLTLEALNLFAKPNECTFLDPPKPVNGTITIPELPGLGLTLNDDWIRKNAK